MSSLHWLATDLAQRWTASDVADAFVFSAIDRATAPPPAVRDEGMKPGDRSAGVGSSISGGAMQPREHGRRVVIEHAHQQARG